MPSWGIAPVYLFIAISASIAAMVLYVAAAASTAACVVATSVAMSLASSSSVVHCPAAASALAWTARIWSAT
jgi:hypothetical protein